MSEPKDPLLGSIDINELLSLAHDTHTDDKPDLHKELQDPRHIDVRNFIRAKNFQHSEKPIPTVIVYDYYCQWSQSPCTVTMFNKFFSHYYPMSKYIGVTCFKINPESLGMPEYYSVYRDPRFSRKKRKLSKLKGVYNIDGYFIARIELEDNIHFIGRFKTEGEAATAYDIEAYYHFGNKTDRFNFPWNVGRYEEEIKKRKNQETD